MSVIEDAPAVKDNDITANNSNHAPSGKDNATKASMRARLLVTSVALAAAVFHLIWSDLKVDGVIVALIVVALMPWLGAVFDSIELPGGVKVICPPATGSLGLLGVTVTTRGLAKACSA